MEPQSATTPGTPKNATSESVATPNGVTSAASTIAEKEKESAARIDSTATEKMTAFSRSLADIQPTGLTPAESKQEAAQRGKLSIAVEVFIRSDLQFKAAGRKRDHARYEFGEQLAGFKLFYKPDRVWGAVKNKLAEGLGFRSSKTIDRIIDNYESQKQITKAERVVAGRLDIPVTPALVKELVVTQLKEGICKTEQDAYRRVEQASKQVEQKAEKMAAADPLRESCVKALGNYLKTIAPDKRAERLAELTKAVSATLESELEEDESQNESAA
jgi:hypothetical protein